MDINLIQTKPNEYAYLNDINLTVIETNSDALCPPDSVIKEIISKEGKLIFLNFLHFPILVPKPISCNPLPKK